jgi:aminopeptidase N
VVGAAAECFSALDSYLDKAEEVFGEYVWGNYTILVLPPSFPFGGMENPLRTFASPTVVTQDTQPVVGAIHEIMHSWFGNTITMNNWTDFWLNEGFTVFAERTISGLEFGEEFKKVQAQIGVGDMKADMQVFGYNHSYSSLQPHIQHDNPDNMFSTVPYEKGYFFLTYLASQIGHDNFIQFLREYILQFRFTSISTADFLKYFQQHCGEHSYDIS